MTPRNIRRRAAAAIFSAVALAAAGCGDGDDSKEEQTRPGGASNPNLEAAAKVSTADFPVAGGKTLQQVADLADPGSQLGMATSVFAPGENRVGFGVIDQQQRFLYGKTALYVARSGAEPAEGPYPAPAHSLVVEPPFRSRNAAQDNDTIAAIYSANVPFKREGKYELLALTKVGDKLIGATGVVDVHADSRVPAVGEKAPSTSTDTLSSVGGDARLLETRQPADNMHQENFEDVLGKRPVALLFATPQLCQTRVCGPVTDIAAQLQKKYGDRMTFIHQEVYKNNVVEEGLREPLRDYSLETEPWLFVVDADGKVAARLEGSFGVDEFEAAVQRGL